MRQDGRSASLTAPSGVAQQGLLRASINDAGIEASELSCGEAHGTGTALGDPIEAGSLAGALLSRLGVVPMALGSGKANVGHAEPAAGATGLLKLLVQLRAGECAPNAQLTLVNPHVRSALEGLACSLPQQLVRPAGRSALAGGVGSFGYSGTIVHAVLSRATHTLRSFALSPLRFRRAKFLWISTTDLTGRVSLAKRRTASLAAERALDAACCRPDPFPNGQPLRW